MNPDLLPVNVTVDQITQGYRLLRRFNEDTDKLTQISVISNLKDIPQSTATVRYEDMPLDSFIGEKVTGWDGHSPITLYFNDEGHFDHWEKTASTTAAGASAA
jgi:hypothetical protein